MFLDDDIQLLTEVANFQSEIQQSAANILQFLSRLDNCGGSSLHSRSHDKRQKHCFSGSRILSSDEDEKLFSCATDGNQTFMAFTDAPVPFVKEAPPKINNPVHKFPTSVNANAFLGETTSSASVNDDMLYPSPPLGKPASGEFVDSLVGLASRLDSVSTTASSTCTFTNSIQSSLSSWGISECSSVQSVPSLAVPAHVGLAPGGKAMCNGRGFPALHRVVHQCTDLNLWMREDEDEDEEEDEKVSDEKGLARDSVGEANESSTVGYSDTTTTDLNQSKMQSLANFENEDITENENNKNESQETKTVHQCNHTQCCSKCRPVNGPKTSAICLSAENKPPDVNCEVPIDASQEDPFDNSIAAATAIGVEHFHVLDSENFLAIWSEKSEPKKMSFERNSSIENVNWQLDMDDQLLESCNGDHYEDTSLNFGHETKVSASGKRQTSNTDLSEPTTGDEIMQPEIVVSSDTTDYSLSLSLSSSSEEDEFVNSDKKSDVFEFDSPFCDDNDTASVKVSNSSVSGEEEIISFSSMKAPTEPSEASLSQKCKDAKWRSKGKRNSLSEGIKSSPEYMIQCAKSVETIYFEGCIASWENKETEKYAICVGPSAPHSSVVPVSKPVETSSFLASNSNETKLQNKKSFEAEGRLPSGLLRPPYRSFEKLLMRPESLIGLRIALKRARWPKELLLKNLTPIKELGNLRCPSFYKETSNLKLMAGGYMKAHPMKGAGEDSYFVCENQRGIGVADGVSEWRNFGVNPRRFADQLMVACKKYIDSNMPFWTTLPTELNTGFSRVKYILNEAFSTVTAYGGSTASLAILDSCDAILEVANLGDSTVCVFRRDAYSGRRKIVFRSKELQHFFNLPYQLMNIPGVDDVPYLMDNGCHRLADVVMKIHKTDGRALDRPDDAQCYKVPLREGDLVILGTDGVFDNLFEEEICDILSLAISPVEAKVCARKDLETSPVTISKTVVECAYQRSTDTNVLIPFILNAEKAGRMKGQFRKLGGKQDDITVAAAWVISTFDN